MGVAGSGLASDDDRENWFRSSFPELYCNNLAPNQSPNLNYGMSNYPNTQFRNYQPYKYNNGTSPYFFNNLTPNQPPNVDYGMNNYPNTQSWNYQPYNNSTSPYFGGTFNYCRGCEDYRPGKLIYHPNGSRLCQDCISRTLVDTKMLQRTIGKVQKFYQQHGLEFRTDYPILLVDQKEIRRAFGSISRYKGKTILGLTAHTPEEVMCITNYVHNGENIEVVKEKIKVKRAVLLFYDSHEAKLGGTLAHEMMHAYLGSKRGYMQRLLQPLKENTEEGLCCAISHMWFENEAKSNHESYYHSQLVKGKIEIETTNVYGNGFREAKRAIDTFGLRHTLKTLVKKGKLPE